MPPDHPHRLITEVQEELEDLPVLLRDQRPVRDVVPVGGMLISGDKDPVGGMGKGVKKVNKYLVNSGHTHLTFKLYPGARHEILNGICRNEVYGDVLLFLEAVAAGGEQS